MKQFHTLLQMLCSCLSLYGNVIKKFQKSDLYDSNIRLCLKILKMGSITFFGEFHIGTGTEAIFFSDHTDFFLPLAIGHLSCRVLKVCDLSTISQRPYLLGSSTLGHLFSNPWMKFENLLPFFPLNREKVSVQMWTFFEECYWPYFQNF